MSNKPVLALLLIVFMIPALMFVAVLFTGQKDVSDTENRNLTRFPALTVDSVLEGSFQDELEDALNDQLPGAEQIKLAVRNVQSGITALETRLLSNFVTVNYQEITEGYYHYAGDAHRIVEKPIDYAADEETLISIAARLEAPKGVPEYLYFIENSRVVSFDDLDTHGDIYDWVRGKLTLAGSDMFTFTDYADFCTKFYQTDHHWKADASYAGYQAIIRMLKGESEPLVEKGETITVPVVFNGSYARLTGEKCADEEFSFISFDLSKYKTYINGKKSTYGHMTTYERGKYPEGELANHYSYCYGGDFAEVVYDFGTTGNGNLLMVASSYSNPINALIASHYDRTYVVDLRYYEDYAGAPFDVKTYCADKDISAVLLLGDVNMFVNDEAEKGGDAE